jgi:ATP-binding cassette subfamily C exporter for protease/lipase
VISHRSNVLEAADQLLILREGQVQAFGPRDQILNAIKEAKEKHLQQLRDAGQLKLQATHKPNGDVK